MREGWSKKRLRDVADVFAGQSAPQKQEDYSSNGTPFIKAGNLFDLINGTEENSIQKVTDFSAQKNGLKKYKSGSVLFAKSGMSCLKGYVYVMQNDCYVVSHLAIIQPKAHVISPYLKYHFMYHKPYLFAKDTAYPSISITDISNYVILVPDISKQKQITYELDMITELISKYDEQLKELDKLSQSIFYEMFGDPVENEKGWKQQKLGEIADFKNGLNYKKTEKGFKYKFLGVSDFQDKMSICSSSLKDIILDEEIKREYYLQDGDLVFVRSNGSKELVGRSIIVMTNGELTTYSGFCIRCRIKSGTITSMLLSSILTSPSMKPLITNSGRGCNISNLNQKILSSLDIILPPLSLQQSFARKIEAIEAMKAKVKEAKKEAETLLAARMQYWFE